MNRIEDYKKMMILSIFAMLWAMLASYYRMPIASAVCVCVSLVAIGLAGYTAPEHENDET